jgi:hypothetical protein
MRGGRNSRGSVDELITGDFLNQQGLGVIV